jgi:hypothetical protein
VAPLQSLSAIAFKAMDLSLQAVPLTLMDFVKLVGLVKALLNWNGRSRRYNGVIACSGVSLPHLDAQLQRLWYLLGVGVLDIFALIKISSHTSFFITILDS